MTDQEKKIHNLKFELRQQRQRIDILEQRLTEYNKFINIQGMTNKHLFEVVNTLTDVVIALKMEDNKEKEEKQ